MKPTEEQVNWFWKKCGGIHKDYQEEDGCPAHYEMPSGRWIFDNSEPDLNSLFKCAVPKLIEEGYILLLQYCAKSTIVQLYRQNFGKLYQDFDKAPALALFWAIHKVLGGKR